MIGRAWSHRVPKRGWDEPCIGGLKFWCSLRAKGWPVKGRLEALRFLEVLSFGEIPIADDLCTSYRLGTYGDDNRELEL